jgi:hypothetical protein
MADTCHFGACGGLYYVNDTLFAVRNGRDPYVYSGDVGRVYPAFRLILGTETAMMSGATARPCKAAGGSGL